MAQNWSIIVPEATTNLCTNPSFEQATTGWSASGSNTIARSAAQQFAGVYSLLCTYQNNTTLATLTISSGLSTGTTYTVTARLRVPAGWGGGDIRLNASGFSGATVTQVREWDSATGDTDKWVELEIRLATSSDTTGTILLQATSAPSPGTAVYLDAVQIEQKAYPTTYCDGDQDGCEWNGAAHASTSTRDEFEASGGRLRNLDTDFEFLTGLDEGTGVFPLQMNFHPQPLLPGDNFQGINVLSRSNLLLRGSFDGETTPGLHAKRQALAKALNSRVGRIDRKPQARQLYYHGAAVEKRIGVHYVAGLGVKDRIGTIGERVDGLQFYAPDPVWYDVGERGAVLDTNDSSIVRIIIARINGQWNVLGPPDSGGTYSAAYALEADDTYVYIGGSFTNFDNIASADRIVRLNKHTLTYSAMASGLNGLVRRIRLGPSGDLYVVGDFTDAGGVAAADYLARWTGSAFTNVGTSPFTSGQQSLHVARDGKVYVSDRVYDGSSWSIIGSGIGSGIVLGIDDDAQGNIYFGGSFTTFDGVTVNRIAKWDGANITDLGGGFSSGTVRDVVVLPDNTVLVGGTFPFPDFLSGVLKWNGQAWEDLNAGDYPTSVQRLAVSDDGLIYAIGNDVFRVWNGSQWLIPDLNHRITITALFSVLADGDDLYVGNGNSGSITYFFSGLTTIPYSGTAEASPAVKIARSGGDSAIIRSLRNETTGATLYMDYSLLDGESLTLEFFAGKVSVVSSYFGPAPMAVLPSSDISNFFLTPGNQSGSQDNVITCFVDESGSPTVTAVMKWRDAYFSYD